MIVTGGWDKTLKFWPVSSLGTGTPAATVQLSDRVYAMDVKGDCMVVALGDRQIHVFDVRNNPSAPMKSHTSPLRHQIRTISLFPDKRGYAIGSIEGRVQIWHINDSVSPSLSPFHPKPRLAVLERSFGNFVPGDARSSIPGRIPKISRRIR